MTWGVKWGVPPFKETPSDWFFLFRSWSRGAFGGAKLGQKPLNRTVESDHSQYHGIQWVKSTGPDTGWFSLTLFLINVGFSQDLPGR